MGSERLSDERIAAIKARATRAAEIEDPSPRLSHQLAVDAHALLAEVARLRAVEAAAITACELEGGPGEDAALEDLRAALRGGR